MKYLGNKTRLEDFLNETIELKRRPKQTALDLFAGTGAVSLLFKRQGLNTVSNDFLTFCYHRINSILLDKSPEPNLPLQTEQREGFITKNYSDSCGVNIFRRSIAKHIDGARSFLRSNRASYDSDSYSYYLAQIIEAADFRSNIMGSYESFYKAGWRKQCEKSWALSDFELYDSKGVTKHSVFNRDALKLLEDIDDWFDFIYLDPPYNTRQYASVFHVLETISLYDNPSVSGVVKKSIDSKNKRSNFSSKRACHQEMKSLIQLCGKKTDEVYMSYSNEGIVKPSEIISLLKDKFVTVDVYEYDYRRFKTNSRKKTNNTKVKEYLFHGVK